MKQFSPSSLNDVPSRFAVSNRSASCYETLTIDDAFRADLVVEGKVIVEIKSIELVQPVHKKQLLTYLRLSHLRLGLLINFGSALLRSGITRMVNGLDE